MPEYLYPGVYVEESDYVGTPIDGVSTSTADLTGLAAEMSAIVRRDVPGWTGNDDSDPGVTLVQLFAFLSETLLYRTGRIPEHARSAAARAALALSALGRVSPGHCKPVQRPSFFAGRLLDAATLGAEQDYHREKLRRHNRALLGYGVVSGLAVHIDAASENGAASIVIEPGYAVDGDGEEIALPCGARVAMRDAMPGASANGLFVTLRFWQRPSDETAATGASTEPTMFEELALIGLAPDAVMPAIGLARLLRTQTGWQLDPGYTPPHVR